MSHPAQRKFCKQVRRAFPSHFRRSIVVDVGSMDINGNNRGLFYRCHYVGIDLQEGKNVTWVGRAHEVMGQVSESCKRAIEQHYRNYNFVDFPVIDTIISTEALEHDSFMERTLHAMYFNLKSGGLMLITAAGDGRKEHGTYKVRPQDSPHTNEFYRNVSNADFYKILPPSYFKTYFLRQIDGDFQFYGIKK